MQFKYSVLAVSLATVVSLSGCNSDVSGDDFEAAGHVVVTAMDGYLNNALVCSDTNENGECELGEKLGLTAQDGTLALSVSVEKQAQILSYPIIVKILSPQTSDPRSYIDAGIYTAVKILQPMATHQRFNIDKGIYTVDMDQPYQVMAKDVVYRAPAGITLVSPLTDLVVAEMYNGRFSQVEAEQRILALLNELVEGDNNTVINLYADYMKKKESAVSSDAEKLLAAKLHKIAQVLTETKHRFNVADLDMDRVIEEVISASVDAVNKASDTELFNPDFKPTVTFTEDGTLLALVNNYQAVTDKNVLDKIVIELDEQKFKTEIGIDFKSEHFLTGLFTDKNQNQPPIVSINNSKQLKAENLIVSLVGDRLTIKDVKGAQRKSLVRPGVFYIELTADDYNCNNEKIGTVKTRIPFKITDFSKL